MLGYADPMLMDTHMSMVKLARLAAHRPGLKVVLIVRNPLDAFESKVGWFLTGPGYAACDGGCDVFGDALLRTELENSQFGRMVQDLQRIVPRENVQHARIQSGMQVENTEALYFRIIAVKQLCLMQA